MAPPETYAPPNLKGMSKYDSMQKIEGYESWSPEDVADYFESEGLGDYRELIIYHKISGKIAHQLKDSDMKDMGIDIVGDRCRFRQIVKTIGRRARAVQRNKVIWEGKEQLFYDNCEKCVNTCCFIFPEDPSTYRLTNNHLKVKTVEPTRLGPIRLCCCHKYQMNNIDLSQVKDVDMAFTAAPACQHIMCCAWGKDTLDIEIEGEPNVYVIVREGEGERVATLIMNQVEESQMIERD